MERGSIENTIALMEPDEETDADETEDGEEEIEENVKDVQTKSKVKGTGRTVLSGRGVTLKMLVDDGILNVGEGCMSIDYLVSK